MPGSRLHVHLFRDSFNTPWGFRLQGGKDLHQPLIVQRVFSNSPAEGELQRGDVILSINNRDAGELTHKQAQDLIKHGGGQVQLVVNRPPPGVSLAPLSPPIITHQPRAPSLAHPPVSSHGGHGFQPTKVTLNKFGGGGRDLGADYGQRYDKHDMLNRVQNSLDNLVLSPRSPEVHTSSPFYQPYSPPYQPYSPPYQPPQHVYTPTGLLLEQQQLQQQQDQGEALPPVWERRRQFQQASVQRPGPAPAHKPAPRVAKPQPGPTTYGNFGIDYSQPTNKPAQTGWRPAPHFSPSQAPVKSAGPHYTPKFAPPPTAAKPGSQAYAPAHSAPPPWQRAQDQEDGGTPAWGTSLKTTGVKPWDTEAGYTNEQAPIRSVPYTPAPPKSPITSGPFSPAGTAPGGSENGPKVVHLQYNSPLHLYSNQNVAETLKGQTQAMSGQAQPGPATLTETGERDWSQSAVLRFISQEENKKGKPHVPAVAPKPQFSPMQAARPFYQDPGATEF
ncbi:hypothetical protein BsWGS_20593 [Bradybaena similaris]